MSLDPPLSDSELLRIARSRGGRALDCSGGEPPPPEKRAIPRVRGAVTVAKLERHLEAGRLTGLSATIYGAPRTKKNPKSGGMWISTPAYKHWCQGVVVGFLPERITLPRGAGQPRGALLCRRQGGARRPCWVSPGLVRCAPSGRRSRRRQLGARLRRVPHPLRRATASAHGIRALPAGMMWERSHRFDRRALPLADRHYNRRKVGSPQFVPPGRCFVLLTPEADAVWVTSWPYPQYVRHAWPGAWICSIFRNEGPRLSSELIREAVARTRAHYGEPPVLGMVTFVNPKKIRSGNPGYCFLRAGFRRVGLTKGGLVALQMLPHEMP